MQKIWMVITCMGRLMHLKKTLPILRDKFPQYHYLLVDYDCPDKSGNWVEKEYPEATVIRMKAKKQINGRPIFNKCIALNAGAKHAFDNGATHVMFIDADVVPNSNLSWVEDHLSDDTYIIPDWRTNTLGVYGFTVAPKEGFFASGLFNEDMDGYGSEDTDMRLRLYLKSGLEPVFITPKFGDAIEHGDFHRTRFYQTKEKRSSQYSNILLMDQEIKKLLGKSLKDICAERNDPDFVQKIRDIIGIKP